MMTKSKLDASQLEAQTQILKVLTHPARIAILNILRDGEHCVCHIEAYLGYRQAYISQQLAVLREAGLVQDRRDGWNIFYSVVNPKLYEVLDAVQKFAGQKPYTPITPSVSCHCPHCSSERSEM